MDSVGTFDAGAHRRQSRPPAGHALRVERSCAVVASAFSERRRESVRLMSGERRSFGMNAARTVVNVPYPALAADWTLRTWTCGIALQCAPSKDRIARYPLQDLTGRERRALAIVEGQVALGWVGSRWPGLLAELRRLMPELEMADADLDGRAMLERAVTLARSNQQLNCHPLLGELPLGAPSKGGFMATLRRWPGCLVTGQRHLSPNFDSILWAATAVFRIRTFLLRVGRRRKTSRSAPIRGSASRTPSGTSGRRPFSGTTWPFSSASMRRVLARPGPSPRACADGSRSTRIAR